MIPSQVAGDWDGVEAGCATEPRQSGPAFAVAASMGGDPARSVTISRNVGSRGAGEVEGESRESP
jgi:hypothetical protein